MFLNFKLFFQKMLIFRVTLTVLLKKGFHQTTIFLVGFMLELFFPPSGAMGIKLMEGEGLEITQA
jgi:hypothetical protein